MAFGEIDTRRHNFLKVYVQKNREATKLFVDLSKAFDSIEESWSKYYSPT